VVLERDQKATPVEISKIPKLSGKTYAFIRHAFACGAVEVVDEKRKLLLARYIVDDHLTLKEVKRYTGVKTARRAKEIYDSALKDIWEISPLDVQRKFPKEEIVLIGKRRGPKEGHTITPETREKVSVAKIGKKFSEEHKARLKSALNRPEVRSKLSAAKIGKKHTEETKEKMRQAYRERRRKQREQKQRVVLIDPKSRE
jgi:hypothetical protein